MASRYRISTCCPKTSWRETSPTAGDCNACTWKDLRMRVRRARGSGDVVSFNYLRRSAMENAPGVTAARSMWVERRRLASFAIAIAASLGAMSALAADNVSFATNWLISGKNAGYFTAIEKGFYAEQGLHVTISRGNGSGDTIKRIAAGESDFGLSDTASLISSQTNDGVPVKMVGLMFGKSSVAILYVEEAGIRTPKDLIGKKLGRSAAGASVIMFPGFLKANGIDRSKIEEVVVNASSFLPLLLWKKA